MSSFVAVLTANWTDKTGLIFSTLEGFGSQVFARLGYKSSGIAVLLLTFFVFEFIFPHSKTVFATPAETFGFQTATPSQTATAFSEQSDLRTQVLAFKSRSVADPSVAEGESKIIQTGVAGKKVIQTKTIFHNGQKYAVESSVVSETKPVEELVAVHPSTFSKTLETPYGTLKYREKLTVWATSYDPFCRGCNSVTSIGLKAGYGVVAVDPKVIPLRSKIYVPGYGVAIAGDTGGSIKGHKVDLGFDDVKLGNWSSRFTELYILES